MAGELTCEHLTPSLLRLSVRPGLGISIRVAGVSIYHQGSANLIDEAIRDPEVDVFLAGIAGRNFTQNYWKRILPRLDPQFVVPTHYDNFFRPLSEHMELILNVKLSELSDEIQSVSRDVTIAAMPRLG
jgi:L-ascorbate metabolism protein UlaG (beta-lactamase superfamily)